MHVQFTCTLCNVHVHVCTCASACAVGGEDASVDDIYPFAWALDGRRIGENPNTVLRSDSPTSYLVSAKVNEKHLKSAYIPHAAYRDTYMTG